MEPEATESGQVRMSLNPEVPKDKDDDIWFLLLGDASWGSVFVSLIYVVAFGGLLLIGVFSYAFFSGGMQWLFVLFILSLLTVVSVMIMKRGISRQEKERKSPVPTTTFSGELAELTETVERASSSYAYSQQILRERVSELIMDRARMANYISREEAERIVDKGEVTFLEDETLAKYIIENKRGAEGWDDKVKARGRSREEGRRFMNEINSVLDRMETVL